jgi:two-component system sensor histidine kinase ChvG
LFSPLTWRILAINILAPAVLGGGFLYLGEFRAGLVQTRIEALFEQASLIAGAIGETALAPGEQGPALDPWLSRQVMRRMIGSSGVRMRLFDEAGELVADSRTLAAAGRRVLHRPLAPPDPPSWLTDVLTWAYDRVVAVLPGDQDLSLYEERPVQLAEDYVEVLDALAGMTSSELRRTERGEVMISVAVPVQGLRKVVGALLLNIDSSGVEREVRELRLDILKLFAAALTATVMLSLYLASTIARPVRLLARAADAVRTVRGRRVEIPSPGRRDDEIGELAEALQDMTESLYRRMDAIEMFVADVTHEIKNPLTSLRSAVETLEKTADADKQRRLTAIVKDDVGRLDRLLGDIAGASRLDTELSRTQTDPVDLARLLKTVVEVYRETAPEGPRIELSIGPGAHTVLGVADRLGQVVRNLLDNATSFTPAAGRILITLGRNADRVRFTVDDDGPGIPEGKLTAVFDRFYSERPPGEAFGIHSGLGLSISRQIVEAFAGTITAANRTGPEGQVLGARFTVELPLVSPARRGAKRDHG